MICKIINGQAFRGCVQYNLEKVDNGKGEILFCEGVRETPSGMTADFETQAALSHRVQQAVIHTSVSFHAKDTEKLDNEVMKNIARDYLREMGLENTQYAVIRHHDKEHPHFHIIANKVDNDGKGLKNQFYNFLQAKKISEELEQKYGLTVAVEKDVTLKEQVKNMKGEGSTPEVFKREVQDLIQKALGAACTSFESLKVVAQKEKIELLLKEDKTGRVVGISFSKGELKIKGSDVSQQFSAKHLEEKLTANRIKADEKLLNQEKESLKEIKTTQGEVPQKNNLQNKEEKGIISGSVPVKDEPVMSHHPKNKPRRRI